MKCVRWLLAGVAIAIVPACACESELCRVGGGSISIGSGSGLPSKPIAPPVDFAQNPYAGYETHGAVSRKDCERMLERFLREGRRVRLVRVDPNPYNQGGGVLQYICVFTGDDASEEATPFEDDRFPQNEYTYP